MIEIKNVNKIYKTKKGLTTQALSNVNLNIGNKGIVFIVGTSGSGKSTLLNLLGGIDTVSSGEIIINDKKINEFNEKELDSYRNSVIGFIFQEYNVLEQYNVYENIELSLKLQNKEVNKEKLENLLNNLGLNNLGNRQINELSGGQKQRVAIARALIKNPNIILADEPTGNLDKNSTKQIFEILKLISKEKLVIVVSHDIEAAKIYADRIIQIEDGKIVNDTNQESLIEHENLKLTKSKLPLYYILKMVIKNLKHKPFKLIMTIILTTISFVFMSFAINCTLFNKNSLIINTMKNNNNYIYEITNTKYSKSEGITNLELNEEDLKNIKNLTNKNINPVYSLYDNGNSLKFTFNDSNNNSLFYNYKINDLLFIEVNDNQLLNNIIGQEPKNNNEIVIHKYLADYIINFGIQTPNNNYYYPKNYNEIINDNKEISLGQNKVKIVGIINDNENLFKEIKEKNIFKSQKEQNYFYDNYCQKGRYIYVNKFTDSVILNENKESLLEKMIISKGIQNHEKFAQNKIKAIKDDINVLTKEGNISINNLNKDEIILSINDIKKIDIKFQDKLNEYLQSNINKTYEESLIEYIQIYLNENNETFNLKIYANNKLNLLSLKLKGITLEENNYISFKYIEEYKPILKQIYSIKIYDENKNNLNKSFSNLTFKEFNENIEGTYYSFTLDNANDISNVIGIYKYLGIYILIISMIFILFTFLLFSNFISISISHCKKEIGILRALGSRNKDIIKMFCIESLLIGFISWIISIIGLYIVVNLLNNSLFSNMLYKFEGIIIHPLIPIIILIFETLIAFLITSVSINKITKIKPIDAILDK